MTAAQITIVKKSWKILSKINPELLGDAFYSKLFFDVPELKTYLKTDPDKQYRRLVFILNSIVTSLDRPGELKNEIARLVKNNKENGMLAEHCDKVGAALLWTIYNTLNKDLTPEIEEAWAAFNKMLKKVIFSLVES
jgi:hemoglobin-like flavoprotein